MAARPYREGDPTGELPAHCDRIRERLIASPVSYRKALRIMIMKSTSALSGTYSWSAVDVPFLRQVTRLAGTPEGRRLHQHLSWRGTSGQPSLTHGVPLRLHSGWRARLAAFVTAYHRLIETIVAAHPTDERLQQVIHIPDAWARDVVAADDARVHFFRVDLLPQPDNGIKALETNANSPAGLRSTGIDRACWRPFLTERGIRLPGALPSDARMWAGQWFLDLAEQETGTRPETVAVLRPRKTASGSTDGIVADLGQAGVRVLVGDPRDLRTENGGVTLDGEPVRCAYLKVRIAHLLRMRRDLGPFVKAVRDRTLFVQNGLCGRLIGENKLCLAVLSDPRFAGLFPPAEYTLVKPSIPWSRNIARCDAATVQEIRACPERYVLKKPLDSRGAGVVVGREEPVSSVWEDAVSLAIAERWLVQEYCPAPWIGMDPHGQPSKHDLALGVVDGQLAAAFSRTGTEERLNTALSGRIHPVYL
ncbi:hypothetical protein [Streptomyces sclerotialus]|uniref:hypothetical protein n=1 Tax=Streptomyces sclerotialus TaxID=1957 RepID=UPI0004C94D6C